MTDLTVIVPLYNTEKYIEQCLTSILNQSFRDIEVIIVDDGSTDSGVAICEAIATGDDRVKIIHQENRGLSMARYAGLVASRTHYVTFVDADDFILEKSYIMAVEAMQKNVDMISFEICRYYDENNYKRDIHMLEEEYYTRENIVREVYPKLIWNFERNIVGTDCSLCTKIIKRELLIEVFDKIKGQRFYFGEDAVIAYPLYKMVKDIQVIRESYYMHRQRREECAPYILSNGYFEEVYKVYNHLIQEFCQDSSESLFRKQIEYFYMYYVKLKKQKYRDNEVRHGFIFPFDKVEKGKKIALYGAGAVGRDYYYQLKKLNYCKSIIWLDRNYAFINRAEVVSPNTILDENIDYIVIAIEDEKICQQVKYDLVSKGIQDKKIVF